MRGSPRGAALMHTAAYSWHPPAKRGLPGAFLMGSGSVAKILLAPVLTRRLIEPYVRRPPPGARSTAVLAALTERELEVLRCLGRGQTNAEIAAKLYLSQATIRTHVSHILAKLNLRDRVQAVVLAYETGLIQPGQS